MTELMNKELHIYLEDTGNIIIEFDRNLLKSILKFSLPFTKSSTGISYRRYLVREDDNYATIWLPDFLHIDECEIFYRSLIKVLKLYFELSNDSVDVIGEI